MPTAPCGGSRHGSVEFVPRVRPVAPRVRVPPAQRSPDHDPPNASVCVSALLTPCLRASSRNCCKQCLRMMPRGAGVSYFDLGSVSNPHVFSQPLFGAPFFPAGLRVRSSPDHRPHRRARYFPQTRQKEKRSKCNGTFAVNWQTVGSPPVAATDEGRCFAVLTLAKLHSDSVAYYESTVDKTSGVDGYYSEDGRQPAKAWMAGESAGA